MHTHACTHTRLGRQEGKARLSLSLSCVPTSRLQYVVVLDRRATVWRSRFDARSFGVAAMRKRLVGWLVTVAWSGTSALFYNALSLLYAFSVTQWYHEGVSLLRQ
jgi:hypothetical protein